MSTLGDRENWNGVGSHTDFQPHLRPDNQSGTGLQQSAQLRSDMSGHYGAETATPADLSLLLELIAAQHAEVMTKLFHIAALVETLRPADRPAEHPAEAAKPGAANI